MAEENEYMSGIKRTIENMPTIDDIIKEIAENNISLTKGIIRIIDLLEKIDRKIPDTTDDFVDKAIKDLEENPEHYK